MKTHGRKTHRWFAALCAGLWLVAGCGGSGGSKHYLLATDTRVILAGDKVTYNVSGTITDPSGGSAKLDGSLTQTVEDRSVNGMPVKALVGAGNITAGGGGGGSTPLDGLTYVSQDAASRSLTLVGDDQTGGMLPRFAPAGTKYLPGAWSTAASFADTVTFDDGSTLQRTFTVVGTETVHVPAGTFETWIVQETSIDDIGSASTYTNWYAPQLGTYVKSDLTVPFFDATIHVVLSLKSTTIALQ